MYRNSPKVKRSVESYVLPIWKFSYFINAFIGEVFYKSLTLQPLWQETNN